MLLLKHANTSAAAVLHWCLDGQHVLNGARSFLLPACKQF
jgi:hypothetical protein